ncbi:hypothetical protein FACS1894109_21450 [Spirochaetia bacterium]|nr:hypothetical protein FACS1894109_21450 [Spirochaetia bacterium]
MQIGFVGCVTTDPNAPPPYQFDGTAWTKTEDYDLVFKGSNWQVLNGSREIASGNVMSSWKVDGNILSFGNDSWSHAWGHAAGTWTLKSGTPKTDTLDGTTWTRTAVLELSFDNGKMFAKDGEYATTDKDGENYTATSKNFSVKYA